MKHVYLYTVEVTDGDYYFTTRHFKDRMSADSFADLMEDDGATCYVYLNDDLIS